MNLRVCVTSYRYRLFLFLSLMCCACGHSSSTLKKNCYVPLHYTEKGIASWYGKDFHGRKTANGEIYDMHKYTAAHKTLPLGSHIRVTNLQNERSIVVIVNDRGPFVKERILDLSYNAARQLDMDEDGLAPIKLEVVQLPKHQKSDAFFIQVGAFTQYENARRMHQKLSPYYQTQLSKYERDGDQNFYRVWIGPYSQLDLINNKLDELKAIGLVNSFIIAQ